MWIALLAALAAYLLIIPPRSIARPDGPHNYVEEEELETAETPAAGELPASTTTS
jgi:DHA2 family multidrug resistance protein